MTKIYNNIKFDELLDNDLKIAEVSKKYNLKFYNFCYNYQFLSCGATTNLLSIYYNLYLVIKN